RITPSVAEQEGQQTETEATGAPQKHHYTLNQQVGSITLGANLFIEVKREYPTKKGTIMIVTVTAISLIGNINKSDKLRV
ncbi:hypothetical protein M2X62_25920, partial [Klebsiella pneumoniae]|nr:hypothetical protein [Klebsiella pneumoniae]